MNRNIRERIARAKRKLTQRLAGAVEINEGGPLTAGKPAYELSDRTRANPWGGIGVIHRLVLKLGLPARINESLHLLKS